MPTNISIWSKYPTFLVKNAALDTVATPILWVDQYGVIGYANLAVLRVLGYSLEAIFEKPIHTLAASMRQIDWQSHWWPKLTTEKYIEPLPVSWQHKKGIKVSYGASVALTEAAGLQFANFSLWPLPEVIPVSPKLLHDLKEGVCLLDSIGRIEYVNNAMRIMLGLNEQALIGNYLLEVITPVDTTIERLWEILHQEFSEIEFQFENLTKRLLDVYMTVYLSKRRRNNCTLCSEFY